MKTMRNEVRGDRVGMPKRWLAVLAVAMAPVTMAVETLPNSIEIKTADQSVTIGVTHNGTPVSAANIRSVKLYVDKHDYDHMITVEKADGAITIRPTEALELGHYDLAINTAQGDVRIPVTALQGIADEGLEARAKRQGVTVDEIRAQLGISQSLGQERIELNLPSVYYVGQSLKIDMTPGAGRTGTWAVNGEPVGSSGASLVYTFEAAGIYDFAYVEKEDGRTVGVALDTVNVVAEPAIPVSVNAGVKQSLVGPDGYGKYTWKLDDIESGTGPTWVGAFEGPGTHRVTVRAEMPLADSSQSIRELTYLITVP
jgi:hypothetical protein